MKFPILTLTSIVAATAMAEPRQFTSSGGKQLEAELVGYADGIAQLKLADERTVPLPLANLSEADREYVDLWATDPSRVMSTTDVTMDQYLSGLGYNSVVYNDEKSAIIVEMTFANLTRKFIINTNLPYSYIDGPVADALGMKTKPTGDFLATYDGSQAGISEGKLENFTFGKSIFESRIFRVVNLVPTGINNLGEQIDGILGYDFLQDFDAVIDYQSKKLHFLPPPPPKDQN